MSKTEQLLYAERFRPTPASTPLNCGVNTSILLGPPPETLVLLLDDPAEHDFASAERLLKGITGEQATTAPLGLPYSVAAILAHMHANVRFNLDLARGQPAVFGEPWPAVTAEAWPELVAAFLADIAELKRVARGGDLGQIVYPATETEPSWTVGYKLAASVAKHNAYHFGQIALLRRLIGAPP